MKLQEIKKSLNDVFVLVDKDTEKERYCFNDEIIKKENANYPIYEAISNAMHESDLTFNFRYQIATKAVDILADLEDWENDDAITESVDSSVPIYTSELMEIYQSNNWAVDEAAKEMGGGEDSTQNAQYGWYNQINQMAAVIKNNLLALIEEDTKNE